MINLGMNKAENSKPKFCPYDVCLIVGTDEYLMITEVQLNLCQKDDVHQWSFAGETFNKYAELKHAWYLMEELEYVNNIFEMIAARSVHPFSSTKYSFDLKDLRR